MGSMGGMESTPTQEPLPSASEKLSLLRSQGIHNLGTAFWKDRKGRNLGAEPARPTELGSTTPMPALASSSLTHPSPSFSVKWESKEIPELHWASWQKQVPTMWLIHDQHTLLLA